MSVPIVIDTGCSMSITPFLDDFTTELRSAQDESMQGLKDSVQVQGVGWVDWTIRDVFNRAALVRTQAYYVPEAKIRLLSTQTYLQEQEQGTLLQDQDKIILMTPHEEQLTFPHDPGSDLPLMCSRSWPCGCKDMTHDLQPRREQQFQTTCCVDHSGTC